MYSLSIVTYNMQYKFKVSMYLLFFPSRAKRRLLLVLPLCPLLLMMQTRHPLPLFPLPPPPLPSSTKRIVSPNTKSSLATHLLPPRNLSKLSRARLLKTNTSPHHKTALDSMPIGRGHSQLVIFLMKSTSECEKRSYRSKNHHQA